MSANLSGNKCSIINFETNTPPKKHSHTKYTKKVDNFKHNNKENIGPEPFSQREEFSFTDNFHIKSTAKKLFIE